jgi:predicted nucleic acid-binding protein
MHTGEKSQLAVGYLITQASVGRRPRGRTCSAEAGRGGNAHRCYDILIAGQAVRSGATLVTADSREFARVRGFAWEDWTVSAGP